MAFLDRWEEEINDFVKKYYQSFFVKNKFVFLKKEAAPGGGSMIYTDSGMLLEITNIKNRFSIKAGPTEGKLFWGLDLIKSYFKITDYRIDEDNVPARKSALLSTFNADDHSGNATFLINNFNRIKTLFSGVNYKESGIQLEKLGLEKQKYV